MERSVIDTIKKLRKEHGLTQEGLAKKLFCKRQKIADWERYKTFPSADDIIALSKIFDVTTDYLFGLSIVKTKDTTLQSVCEYTSLSEESVLKFNFHKELIRKSGNTCPKPLFSIIYDDFISSDNLFKMAHIISSYVTSKMELTSNNNSYNELKKELASYSGELSDIDKIPQEFIDNYTNQITQICENEPVLEKDCKLALFEVQELIKDFAKTFAKNYTEE